jgi:superfamily II DNA or RNA helicase
MSVEERIRLLIELLTQRLGINENAIDKDKLQRQASIIDKFLKMNGLGYLPAITGFGKTWVGLFTIFFMTLKFSEAKTIIVVPTIKLKRDWEEKLIDFRLTNCFVYVVNTYTMSELKYACDLLILDEAHHYVSDNAEIFSKVLGVTTYNMCLSLSATLESNEKTYLERHGINCIDTITKQEGKRMGYVSDYVTYNLGITLNEEEEEKYRTLNDIHNSNFGKFCNLPDSSLNWELAMACGVGANKNAKVGNEWRSGNDWRLWYAREMGWDNTEDHDWSPKNINKYAQLWSWAMRERKDFLYNSTSKAVAAKEVIEYLDVPTITFAENTKFADYLADSLGDKALAYHSNIKTVERTMVVKDYRKTLAGAKKFKAKVDGIIGNFKEDQGYSITYNKVYKVSARGLREEALRKFENGEISTLVTAKALDEGFNVENIQCALICSATSKRRQYIQRINIPVL